MLLPLHCKEITYYNPATSFLYLSTQPSSFSSFNIYFPTLKYKIASGFKFLAHTFALRVCSCCICHPPLAPKIGSLVQFDRPKLELEHPTDPSQLQVKTISIYLPSLMLVTLHACYIADLASKLQLPIPTYLRRYQTLLHAIQRLVRVVRLYQYTRYCMQLGTGLFTQAPAAAASIISRRYSNGALRGASHLQLKLRDPEERILSERDKSASQD